MKDDPYASSTDFATISFPSSGQSERRFHSSDGVYEEPFKSMSPPDPSMTPSWASQLFHSPASTAPIPLPLSPVEPADDLNATLRLPSPFRRPTTSLSQMFISASAPSAVETRPPPMSRGYSRRADSFSDNTDHDASTVRRKRRSLGQDDARTVVRGGENGPLKSALRPPKLAPSAWQLYFTDWISRHQATSSKKLNVAQAAKEAGQEYANLTAAEKEPYKRRSQELKEIREREYDHYIRSLTPDDIKRENVFRTAQRKAGKSRKGNIKDPNAPKKPLSAYFMFLQRIRSDKELVREVFGDETETTKQSVLAAHKWRSMTDEERQPFLAQAEQEKMEYEAARRLYEEGTIGFETSINFRLSPGSPILSASIPRSKQIMFPTKAEVSASSESEGEDF
ncbi:hypothetical protein JAAARDRAFT_116407 [Jaapia argillacea MUCL 33604]|uniref:HMG box domain-containing protein n=1 Tax=Jaapia argillacea MUCL 33604 TaxID=933084 RepID=A0A067QP39_9AGAM|nr:hypothetical protein JAAARDRAFT_116407 [Jaapia argillacea MUCL 33604]